MHPQCSLCKRIPALVKAVIPADSVHNGSLLPEGMSPPSLKTCKLRPMSATLKCIFRINPLKEASISRGKGSHQRKFWIFIWLMPKYNQCMYLHLIDHTFTYVHAQSSQKWSQALKARKYLCQIHLHWLSCAHSEAGFVWKIILSSNCKALHL